MAKVKEIKKEATKKELVEQIKKQLFGVFAIGRKAVAENREDNIAMIKVEEEIHLALDKLDK